MSMYRTRNSEINLNSIKTKMPSKNLTSVERAKFEQSQHASLVKAINNIESPAKEKHVRNIILGSCFEKSVLPFWYNALKLDLFGNQIICWKFCYTVHRLIRDGYSTTVDESFRYTATLEDLAKSWIHLKQGYGAMLFHYCNYVAFKIKFHKKNQFIPGNLMIEDKDMDDIVSNDINNYFQLCCEFFDYLDEILGLQLSIFVTMDRSRSNSMTEAGQCKLAPLVLCIQESNQLYDFCVKFLFKLHDNLPGETLEGHRERFLKIFRDLSKFYECCKNLQYFKNLISIPDLPPNPPNFRLKSDFNSYQKPVMVVVEQPAETLSTTDEDSILVDFNDIQNSSSSSSNNDANNSYQLQLQQQQQQQYMYIQQLLQEIEHLRGELDRLSRQHEAEVRGLREQVKNLQDELMNKNSELEQQKIKTANLEEKIRIATENEKAKADLENLEKKAITSEERFNKMKELYNKLKEEHVNLLRKEADVRKQKSSLAESLEHATKMKSELEKRLETAEKDKQKIEESMQVKLNELASIKSDSEKKQAEQLSANQGYQDHVQKLEEEKRELMSELNECTAKLADLEKLKEELASAESKLKLAQEEKDKIEKSSISSRQHMYKIVLNNTLENCIDIIKSALLLFEDPVLLNCKSGAEYLLTRLAPFHDNYNLLIDLYSRNKALSKNNSVTSEETDAKNAEELSKLINSLNAFTSFISDSVISGKITSITAADFAQGEALGLLCQTSGQEALVVLEKMKAKQALSTDDGDVKTLRETVKKIQESLNELLPKVHDINKQELGDLIDVEMQNTSKAIEEAVSKLAELLSKSREQETGIKLEVNDKILDSCTDLMQAIRILIMKSQELQREIVSQGRGTSTVKEFYSKNHKWTEGLVSAAKLVGMGANMLIEKADKLVNGDGKLEEIIVCSNEIAAFTAQLVVASNVKADRDSAKRKNLVDAKNNVSSCTAKLVASAKTYLETIEDQSTMDFSKISLHQTKRLEMETQVKVLELEKQLEAEKNKLYKLRKQHYQLADQTE